MISFNDIEKQPKRVNTIRVKAGVPRLALFIRLGPLADISKMAKL